MKSRPNSSLALRETAIGLGLLAFAAVVLWQIWAIPVSPIYAQVGPTVFPYATAVGLAGLALLLLAQAARGGWQPIEERAIAIDWRALAFVAAGLLANVALITWLGFTAASTIMFVLIAHGFGSRKPLRDGAIGLAVALAAYFAFAKLLGVNIGAGMIERLLGG
ncbi:MAG TPA: tripartite tricarboxylate transporter TctB family protein [Xanthobacteraceae bacterium]|nr:tripartite tricarboxylate transporter TctB family protein [Xanthobacteraceae bacterium]